MMRRCFVSVDVENDLNETTFKCIDSMHRLLAIFEKHNIRATLFVTGDILKRFPKQVKLWSKKHEIACHGYYHEPLYKYDKEERKKQIQMFLDLYEEVLGISPKGFRAVQHTIDQNMLSILEDKGFNYDSSVIPRYLPFRKYVGFKGKAPTLPYYPSDKNYLGVGSMKILEIPVTPIIFGFSLYGTWLRLLGVTFYKFLFALNKPHFIALSMHPWDSYEYKGTYSKNSGEPFLKKLDSLLKYLKKHYKFVAGDEILENTNRRMR